MWRKAPVTLEMPEHPMRQRRQLAAVEGGDDATELRRDVGGPLAQSAIEVDGDQRQILAEGVQADATVLVDVALADFEEPAVIGQAGQSLRDRLAGQRVEQQINATPIGRLQ